MEINKHYFKKILFIMISIAILFLISGCGKKFWEYDNAWISDTPYIYLPTNEHYIDVEIDGVVQRFDCAWENDGTCIYLYMDEYSFEEEIAVKTIIKNDVLYLSFIEDSISDYEGKTIALHQQPLEETEDIETEE